MAKKIRKSFLKKRKNSNKEKTTFNLRGNIISKYLKAIALSHREAFFYRPLKNTVLISYADYNHGEMATPLPRMVKRRYKAVLELPVNDIDFPNQKNSFLTALFPNHNYHIFNDSDCKKLKYFIKTYKQSHFIVNCDAGVSRSSATALYICYRLAPKDYHKLMKLNIYYPNVLIFSFLKEGKFNSCLYEKYNKILHRLS